MGYREGYSSKHFLISMSQKWIKNRDKGKICVALFVDSPKAINCLCMIYC